jgi:hypothetical protein
MPIVGRGLQHEEGAALIQQWISEMDYPLMARSQLALDQRFESRWTTTRATGIEATSPNEPESP